MNEKLDLGRDHVRADVFFTNGVGSLNRWGVNMRTSESIEAFIIGGLAKIKKTQPETIQKHARLIEDLDIDSLDALDLIFQLEEEFAIEVLPEHQLQFSTVQDVIAYVQQRVGHTLPRSA